MRGSTAHAIIAAVALAVAGCGSDETAQPTPSAQSILPPQASTSGAAAGPGVGTPVIERVALSPAVLVPGTEIRAVVNASDPDGDALRYDYTWKRNGREISSGGKPVLFLADLSKGDRVEVIVTVSDGKHESRPMSAKASVGNRAPVLSAVTLDPFGDVRAGKVIEATPMASDPDHDSLSFEYRWNVNGKQRGNERSFDTKGLRRGDQVQVEVVASDRSLRSRAVRSPILMLGNSPPVITQLPVTQSEDGVFRYTFAARDPDGDRNLRFFLDHGPPGMKMDPMRGVLTWSPTAGQGGVHQVEVGVKDGAGEGSTFVFDLTVNVAQPAAAPAAKRGY